MRIYLIIVTVLAAFLLQSCGEKAPDRASVDFEGLQITLQVPDGVTHQPLSELLVDLQQELTGHRGLDPRNSESSITQLNLEANSKSVPFSTEAFDFILQIMSLGRSTEGLIDLRSGGLAELWSDVAHPPAPAQLDSCVAYLQRSGFISASSSFLIYGPEAKWDTTPLLPAWYGSLARTWLQQRLPQGLLQIGPLYLTIGEPSNYTIPLPPTSNAAENRSITLTQGCLAICNSVNSACTIVNPLTGNPAVLNRTSVVRNQDPLSALGMALAALLQSPEETQVMWTTAEMEGLIVAADGTVTGSADLMTQLQ